MVEIVKKPIILVLFNKLPNEPPLDPRPSRAGKIYEMEGI
jgi:hypothetical protein